MEDGNLQKNEFVREQIKDKPKNHRRIWKKVGTAALCGVVFAMSASLVMRFMMPHLEQSSDTYQIQMTGQLLATERVFDTEADTQEEPSTQEDTEADEVQIPQELSLEDYQRLQTELYAIGNTANKSIVTITSVVSDTDWFNNPYEMEGQGAGAIVDDRAGKLLILTERKVITDASEIYVTFFNNEVASAELVSYDGNTGLAVLSVSKYTLEKTTQASICVMEIGGASTIHKGSLVIALGSPQGINYSILTGIITSTNNEVSTQDHNYSVLSTDIVGNKNSSGILINTEGDLVGVVMQSYSTDSSNTLTAVSAASLQPVLDLLFAGKDIPYIGVLGSTVTDQIAEQYDLPKGVYVKEVTMDSPAMDAGLQSGDVIQSIDGSDITTVLTLSNALLALEPGETYPIEIMREGTNGYQKITCDVKVGVLE
jgi:serine protease Do